MYFKDLIIVNCRIKGIYAENGNNNPIDQYLIDYYDHGKNQT